MWTRVELKQRAKQALQRNYWRIMLVAALELVLSGWMGYSSSASGSSGVGSMIAVDMTVDDEAESEREETFFGGSAQSRDHARQKREDTTATAYTVVFATMVVMIILAILTITFAAAELLYNPLHVGVQRFMLKSVDDRAAVREVAYGFDHSYKNIVKTMFHMDIRIFLWSLLFVVPGIYKQYQYRMVSYILAEHPDMDYKEVLQLSRDMMNGEKWHAFVLDLSFIPWLMLGMITCGIVHLFFVTPYVRLTNAALYRRLSRLYGGNGRAGIPMNAKSV